MSETTEPRGQIDAAMTECRQADEASPKPDAEQAFREWVRDMPLHERTPWNVWHAAVDWVRRNG